MGLTPLTVELSHVPLVLYPSLKVSMWEALAAKRAGAQRGETFLSRPHTYAPGPSGLVPHGVGHCPAQPVWPPPTGSATPPSRPCSASATMRRDVPRTALISEAVPLTCDIRAGLCTSGSASRPVESPCLGHGQLQGLRPAAPVTSTQCPREAVSRRPWASAGLTARRQSKALSPRWDSPHSRGGDT